MDFITIIGFTAGILTTTAQLPQLIKTIQTKKTRDISFWMYLILSIGISLWLIYGLLLKDAPIIFANGTALISVVAVLFFKIKYK